MWKLLGSSVRHCRRALQGRSPGKEGMALELGAGMAQPVVLPSEASEMQVTVLCIRLKEAVGPVSPALFLLWPWVVD